MNVVAYRLIRGESIISPRSKCPHCNHTIQWFDNIPVVSWLLLNGKCRSCHQPISFLYPLIELFTAILFSILLILVPQNYLIAYGIFFSALIVTIRSDIETMLISRLVTLFLVPVGFLLSMTRFLPITPTESIAGTLLGYLILYGTAKLFHLVTGKEGIGEGDFELLAFIGSFIGPVGCWFTLLIGSLIGSCIGIAYILITGSSRHVKIPFGPFLCLGAISFVLAQDKIVALFM